MSEGPFSSLMLIASDGLLQNQGLGISGNLVIAINNYNNTAVVSDYTSILSNAIANLSVANANVANSSVTSNVVYGLQTLSANLVPAITNVVPVAYEGTLGNYANTYSGGFSGVVLSQAESILGGGDVSKFCQIYGIVQSYIVQTNQYINSIANAGAVGNTFTSMNSVTTGSISDVNSNLNLFGADLLALGNTWDLSNLPQLGYPSALLVQMAKTAGIIPELTARLNNVGVDATTLQDLIQNGIAPAANIEAAMYYVMTGVTGELLEQVKLVLRVTTQGLANMADLLNPVKTLPNSYRTLTIPTPANDNPGTISSTMSNIYISANTVNSLLLPLFASSQSYILLSTVTPPDQALANQALAQSLQQIKNIFNLTLPRFASTVLIMETNAGLPDINALTQPIPPDIASSLGNTLATGSGPNGTLVLNDFLGVAAGIPYTEDFTQATANINSLNSANAFFYLTDPINGVFSVMNDAIAGTYTVVIDPGPPEQVTVTIPAGTAGAGVYTSLELAFTDGLIPATANLIANISANNTSATSNLNALFNSMANQLTIEKNNLALAQVNFNEITGNARSAVLAFGSNLHEIGKDPTSNAFFTEIANRDNIYGQAIDATMREGRNIDAMNAAGIGNDTQIPIR